MEISNRLDDALTDLEDVLTGRFNIREIWLFGSATHGTTHPDSDLDILVVAEFDPDRAVEVAVEMRQAARQILDTPLDLIPMSSKRFDADQGVVGSLAHLVTEKGRRIYAQGEQSSSVAESQ